MKYNARYWRKLRAEQRKRYLKARELLRQRIYERAANDATGGRHRD